MNKKNLLENLNDNQKKAVSHENASLAIVAGAGSGKTSVLTKRMAWLMSQDDWPGNSILAVTFTNKAAHEMKDRLSVLGAENVDKMWVGTFHGLAHRFLRIHHKEAGLSRYFQIIDSQEQDKIIKNIFKNNEWSNEGYDYKEAIYFINAQKDEGSRPENCKVKNKIEIIYKNAYVEYQDFCEKNNLVDFGELILRCFELFKNNEGIKLRYQQQFKHCFVDEFQDTNKIQYDLIGFLSDMGQAIPVTVVGDMDQSIYSWRGAKMTNLNRFTQEFLSVTIIMLEQNYRSSEHILNCANNIIKNNSMRIDKNLWTSKKDGDPVVLFEAYNEREEASWVLSQIVNQYKKTQKWSDSAVLYRTNAQSRIIEEECMKRKIPYVIYGGIRFFERAEIKDALSHLCVTVNPDNNLMMERALLNPSKGFGPKALDGLRVSSLSGDKSWKDLLCDDDFQKKYLTSKAKNSWKNYFDISSSQGKKLQSLEDRVRWSVEATGLIDYYKKIDDKDGTDKVANLLELISVARRFSHGKDASSPQLVLDFLSSATLESEIAQDDGDALQLMTIHSSKGLEFPLICAIGWDDGIFPSSRSSQDLSDMEEERRLAYVCITRAEQVLCISGAVERHQYGQFLNLNPSRFLKELPAKSIVWARKPQRLSVSSTILKDKIKNKSTIKSTSKSYWNKSDVVHHPSIGSGVIMRVDGNKKSDKVLVAFSNGEKKIILPLLAKLEKK